MQGMWHGTVNHHTTSADTAKECKHKNDSSMHHCANCDEKGHPACARECPTLAMEWNKKNARTPIAGYKYFPKSNPTTWKRTLNNQQVTQSWKRQEGYNQQWDSGFRQQNKEQWNIVDCRNTNRACPSQSQHRNIQSTLNSSLQPTQTGSQPAPSS